MEKKWNAFEPIQNSELEYRRNDITVVILQEVTCIQRVLIERLATGVGVRERVSTLLGEA